VHTVDGGLLIREARRRAGLTQRELAQRLGTSHAAVARWEKGVVRPSWDAVMAAVRQAGLDLQVRLVEADEHDLVLAHERLLRSPRDRLTDLAAMAAFIERGRRVAAQARGE
jgi:transcriptional regulator with XRE-family HTH domain